MPDSGSRSVTGAAVGSDHDERRRRLWGARLVIVAIFGLTLAIVSADFFMGDGGISQVEAGVVTLPKVDGGDDATIEIGRGRLLVLIFAPGSCSVCRANVASLGKLSRELVQADFFAIVTDGGSFDEPAVEVLRDPDDVARDRFGVGGGRETVVVDGRGRVLLREELFDPDAVRRLAATS